MHKQHLNVTNKIFINIYNTLNQFRTLNFKVFGPKLFACILGWAVSKVDFCQKLILPKTVMAAKYIMLYRNTFSGYLDLINNLLFFIYQI